LKNHALVDYYQISHAIIYLPFSLFSDLDKLRHIILRYFNLLFLSNILSFSHLKMSVVQNRSIMALKAIIDRQSILEQNNVLAVCSIHSFTYWLIIAMWHVYTNTVYV
jgi:hypothetical protein